MTHAYSRSEPVFRSSRNTRFDHYLSHPGKSLLAHTDGVIAGTARSTPGRLAALAALFHDLGKLNPNFQKRLVGEKPPAVGPKYANHAYVSAQAFLAFVRANPALARQLGVTGDLELCAVVALIAHHHGRLPDLFHLVSVAECDAMWEFLSPASNRFPPPDLPVSDYLRQWLGHKPFELAQTESRRLLGQKVQSVSQHDVSKAPDPLGFFLDVQFSFASLIEADRRDASGNERRLADEQLDWAREHFEPCLEAALAAVHSESALGVARSSIRQEAVAKLSAGIASGHRLFTLAAPTGAGKTFTLLAIAEEIRRTHPGHSVIYALPFLTITEQVEAICRNDVFSSNPLFVTRIDSRSQDEQMDALLESLDEAPSRWDELAQRSFSRLTFDAAFIITTFVQVFETLLSNRASTLMRLPNFSRTIFLLDEVQALPPRLYVFFAAYLQAFCKKFDCYAVFSTATMPALEFPAGNENLSPAPQFPAGNRAPSSPMDPGHDPALLFPDYSPPPHLVDPMKYFGLPVFDRCEIERWEGERGLVLLEELAEFIVGQKTSCLVIVNTIEDSCRLYDSLSEWFREEEIVLLNTRFVLDDRRDKIELCKRRLCQKQPIVLVSTQVVEAGVDIDFPVVLRDLCPLPGLIQAAGRSNRNGQQPQGKVWFFELVGANGKSRAELVYRDPADAWLLQFSRDAIRGRIPERELLEIQRRYFEAVAKNLAVGAHRLQVEDSRKQDDLTRRIREFSFAAVGSFRLIEEARFGKEYRYYIPENRSDQEWERLHSLTIKAARLSRTEEANAFNQRTRVQRLIESQLRKISGRVVQFRVWRESDCPPAESRDGQPLEVCGLRKLLLPEADYSRKKGIRTGGTGIAIL